MFLCLLGFTACLSGRRPLVQTQAKYLGSSQRAEASVEDWGEGTRAGKEWRRLATSKDAALDTLLLWASDDPVLGASIRELAVLRGRRGGDVVAEEWPRSLRSRVGDALRQLNSTLADRKSVLNNRNASEAAFVESFALLRRRRARVQAVVRNVNVAAATLAGPWAYNLGLLEAYSEEHGTARVPAAHKSDCGVNLGKWLADQRHASKSGRLSATRRALLAQVDVPLVEVPTFQVRWRANVDALSAFIEANDHADVPRGFSTKGGICHLGSWVAEQRSGAKKGTLAPARRQELEALGVTFGSLRDAGWDAHLACLSAFVGRVGHADVPVNFIDADTGFKVGQWVYVQRRSKKRGKLADDRAKRLDAMGLAWDARDALWAKHCSAVETFHKRYGHAVVPRNYRDEFGTPVGEWVVKQRQLAKAGQLPAPRQKRLATLGVIAFEDGLSDGRLADAIRLAGDDSRR